MSNKMLNAPRFSGNKYLVCEALPHAELVVPCYNEKDVKEAIQELVNEYGCDPKDIAVLPLSAHIPFEYQKVEAVKLSL